MDKLESIINDILRQHKKSQELYEHSNKGIDVEKIWHGCKQEF